MGAQVRQRTFVTCLAMFAIVALVALVAVVAPARAYAEPGSPTINYVEKKWEGGQVTSTTHSITGENYAWWTDGHMNLHNGWWYTRDVNVTFSDRVSVDGGATANVILWDGVTLTFEDGIYVGPGSTLNIYAMPGGTGKLVVGRSEADTAAIGGNKESGTGTINIHGGNVEVTGGSHSSNGGAGIGSGGSGNGGAVNIYSGTVTSNGGANAAGIGGGYKASGGNVNIYGGTVTAKGDSNAAGIGGGEKGNGGNVNIYGGTVNATGGSNSTDGGAGIGGGDTGSGGTTKIYGGNVTATGGHDGAGIGGGDDASGGTVEISGGTVTANGNDSAAIGGGQHGSGGTIIISGGTVTANAGVTSAAIGGGQGGHGGDITISGGDVTAKANTEGAGIGGGDAGGNGGNITITGGTIRATGHDAAGIGGGDNGGSSGTIKISGGEITAIAGVNAAGIGGGYDGACERIEITGGTIKEAKGGSVSQSGGAGIGGGNGHNGGTIIISNANVTAQGGCDAAGIGGGDGNSAGNGFDGGTITISGTLDNTIKATGGNNGAGIGGGQYGNGGTITINGGTVEATGGKDSAGIGGGEYGNGGKVTINGGKVTAKGSPGNVTFEGGAGIGGGDGTKGDAYGNGGEVTITGGEVIATGGCDAAGIGGGDQGKGGIVNISGGKVTATGAKCAAGIGGGDADRDKDGTSHGDGGTVTITGDAHVTAIGGLYGAGIGSGEEGNSGGAVTIGTDGSSTGPTVIATGGQYAAGIGAGDAYEQGKNPTVDVAVRGADVIIYSGNVTATGGEDAAGIGGGEGGSNGTTKIYGGTVVAKAGQNADNDGGAGIGAGDDCIRELSSYRKNTTGGTIEIHGGNVTATGNADGAGIGGGDYGSGGNILITGGSVIANGGAYGAGIGGGECRGAGTVTITGGYVRATGGSDGESKYGGAGIGGGANIANRTSEQNTDNILGGAARGQAIGEDTISISGSAIVVANGGANAAGIGGGTAGGPGSVTISLDESGRVEATGGKHAAGIGGGKGNDGAGVANAVNYGVSGKITINSGVVNAVGGANGGSGIGTGAACGDPNLTTVDVTINGGDVTAKAGAMDENSKYDSGVAIGAGGQYLKDELNDVIIDDGFVIKDVDIPAVFKGTIRFNGGHVIAQAATASEYLDDYLKNALNAVGASRSSNVKNGQVEFNGSTVWMWTDGFVVGLASAKTYSQAVRASENMIHFTDAPEHQNVWYVLTPEYGEEIENSEIHNVGSTVAERVYALTKYDTLADSYNYGLVVVEPQHTHDFKYTAEGDTITAQCSKLSCTLPGHKATLKIGKPLHAKYDDGLTSNNAEKATIEDKYLIQGDAKVEYYKANDAGTGPEGNPLEEGAPIGAGTYWAQITLGSGGNSATAHVLYTIEKADSPARVAKNAGILIGEGQTYPSLVVLNNNITYSDSVKDYDPGEIEVAYEIVGDANGCELLGSILYTSAETKAGKVAVKVTVPGDDNYKALEEIITVTITQKPFRTVTAYDVETTYGEETYCIPVDVNPKTASDDWTLEVKEGYEDVIELNEGDIEVDEDGNIIDATIPHIKPKKVGEAYVIAWVEAKNGAYAPSFKEVKVTVGKAQSVPATVAVNNCTFNGKEQPLVTVEGEAMGGTMQYALGTDSATKPDAAAYSATIPKATNAGTYYVWYKVKGDENHYDTEAQSVTATIAKGALQPQDVRVAAIMSTNDTDQAWETSITQSLAGMMPNNSGSPTYEAGTPTYKVNDTVQGLPDGFTFKPTVDADTGDVSATLQITKAAAEKIGNVDQVGEIILPVTVTSQNYNDATINVVVMPTARTVKTVTIAGVPDSVTYGDTDFTLTATVTGGGTDENNWYWYSSDPKVLEVAAVNGSNQMQVHVRGAGSAMIMAWYEPAEGAELGFKITDPITVNKRPLTIKAKDKDYIYVGGEVPTLENPVEHTDYVVGSVEEKDSLAVGDSLTGLTLAYSPAVDKTKPGDYAIVPSGATIRKDVTGTTDGTDASANYDITYVNGAFTIKPKLVQTISADGVTAVYGDTDKGVSASVTDPGTGGGSLSYAVKSGSGDYIDVNGSTGALSIKKVPEDGVAYVTVTAAETDRYAQTTKDVAITIGKAEPIAAAPTGLTATYGQFLYDVSLEGRNPEGNTPGTWTWMDGFASVGNAGNNTFQATFTPDDETNYKTKDNVNVAVAVAKAPNPATVEQTAAVTVGGRTVDLSQNVDLKGAQGAVTYVMSGDAKGCTLNGSVLVSGDATGEVAVYVAVAEDANYNALEATPVIVSIGNRTTQTITASDVTATYGETGRSIDASTDGDGALTYAVKDGGDYVGVDESTGDLMFKKVGTATITVTAAGTAAYEEASQDVSVRIEKAQLVVRASNLRALLGEAVPSLDDPQLDKHFTLDGLVNGDGPDVLTTKPTLVYQKDGMTVAPSAVVAGTYDIVPSGADAGGNYAIGYQSGELTVRDRREQTITASDVTATYGETGKSIDAMTDGDGELSYQVSGDSVSVDENGALTTSKVGTSYVTVTASGTDDYMPATKVVTVTVDKAQLTIRAKDEQIPAGGTPEGLYDVTGLVAGDTLTTEPTLSYQQNGAAVNPATAPAGTYDIVPSGADANDNYVISYANGELTVVANQVITAPDVAVTYGDKGAYVVAATNGDGALGYAVGEGSEDYIGVDGSTGALTIKKVPADGVAYVTVTAAETEVYARATKDVKVSIAKKKATIQADDQVKYIGDMPADVGEIRLTATVSGTIPGDALAYSLSCDFGDVIQAGSYPIKVTASPDDIPNCNYEITMKSGWFSVVNTPMNMSAKGWSGVYDGKPHAITVDVDVFGGGEYTVEYGTTEGKYDTTANPTQTDAGSLTVYYKVTVGADSVIGSKDVIVEKAPITPSVSIAGWKWGEAPNVPVLAEGSNPGNGNVTYGYARKGGSGWSADVPTAYGDYIVLATVPETTNYFGGTATADFSIAAVQGTLTFNLDGGTYEGMTGPITVKATCGDTIKLPAAPAKDGYTYKFWRDAAGAEYAANASYAVEGDRTFTAVWEKQSEPAPSGDAWLYACVGGAGASWTEGSGADIVITFKRVAINDEGDSTFEHFVSASVDGKPIVRGVDYTVQEGSVIITLKANYLATLATGPHTLTAHFDDDNASAVFTTSKKQSDSGNTAGGGSNGSTSGGTAGTSTAGGATNNGGISNTTVVGGTAGTSTAGGTAAATSGSPSSDSVVKTSDPMVSAILAALAITAVAAGAVFRVRRNRQ